MALDIQKKLVAGKTLTEVFSEVNEYTPEIGQEIYSVFFGYVSTNQLAKAEETLLAINQNQILAGQNLVPIFFRHTNYSLLCTVASQGQEEALKYLLDVAARYEIKKEVIEAKNFLAVWVATRENQTKTLNILIQEISDLKLTQEFYALQLFDSINIAARKGHLAAFRCLQEIVINLAEKFPEETAYVKMYKAIPFAEIKDDSENFIIDFLAISIPRAIFLDKYVDAKPERRTRIEALRPAYEKVKESISVQIDREKINEIRTNTIQTFLDHPALNDFQFDKKTVKSALIAAVKEKKEAKSYVGSVKKLITADESANPRLEKFIEVAILAIRAINFDNFVDKISKKTLVAMLEDCAKKDASKKAEDDKAKEKSLKNDIINLTKEFNQAAIDPQPLADLMRAIAFVEAGAASAKPPSPSPERSAERPSSPKKRTKSESASSDGGDTDSSARPLASQDGAGNSMS